METDPRLQLYVFSSLGGGYDAMNFQITETIRQREICPANKAISIILAN